MPGQAEGWLARRRLPRILLIAALLPLGLLSVLSAAIVVMTSALKGWRIAALDCLLALLIVTVLFAVAGSGWMAAIVNGAVTWSLAVLLGSLTGLYGSLTLAVQVILVLALVGLGVFSVAVPNPAEFWREPLQQFAGDLATVGVQVGPVDNLLAIAPLMGGLLAASIVLTSMMALLLGSWWSSRAGGRPLRPMFLRLRLGYALGGLAALAGLAATVTQSSAAGGALLVLGMGFALQGLAVVHWHAGRIGLPWPAFIPVYGPLCLLNVFTLVNLFLFASVGFVDNWFNLRPERDDDNRG